MASGTEKRHEDVTPEVRERILAYCREALRGSRYPVAQFYAGLAAAPVREGTPAS